MKTIKKIMILFTVFVLMTFTGCISVFAQLSAEGNPSRLYDFDNSIKDSAENSINQKISEVSNAENINIAIVFTDDAEGKSSMEYADDYYDYLFGINTDGVLMLVDHDNSNLWISTSGSVNGRYDEKMSDYLRKELHSGKNDAAVDKFLKYVSGDNLEKEIKMSAMKKAAVGGFIISLIIALIVCSIVKHSYLTNQQITARNYVSGNGIQLNVKQDQFLRTSTTKSVIESDSGRGSGGGSSGSTHISSSGGTHGGFGGHI